MQHIFALQCKGHIIKTFDFSLFFLSGMKIIVYLKGRKPTNIVFGGLLKITQPMYGYLCYNKTLLSLYLKRIFFLQT